MLGFPYQPYSSRGLVMGLALRETFTRKFWKRNPVYIIMALLSDVLSLVYILGFLVCALFMLPFFIIYKMVKRALD
jgi:hypothetical protein